MEDVIKRTNGFPSDRMRPYYSREFQASTQLKLAWAQWADDQFKLETFQNHLDTFTSLIKNEDYLVSDSTIADLLSHISGVDSYLTAGGQSNSLKELLVVIFGHESTGKSSLLDEYLGLEMSFTCTSQGTMQPI